MEQGTFRRGADHFREVAKASSRKCLAWSLLERSVENNEAENERRRFPDRNRAHKGLVLEEEGRTGEQVWLGCRE